MSKERGDGAGPEDQDQGYPTDNALGEPPTEGGDTWADAAWVGGRGTEPPAAYPGKINTKSGVMIDTDDDPDWAWAHDWAKRLPSWSDEQWRKINGGLGYRVQTRRGTRRPGPDPSAHRSR